MYLFEVFTGVSTTALLASCGSNDRLHSVLLDISELKSLHKVT